MLCSPLLPGRTRVVAFSSLLCCVESPLQSRSFVLILLCPLRRVRVLETRVSSIVRVSVPVPPLVT